MTDPLLTKPISTGYGKSAVRASRSSRLFRAVPAVLLLAGLLTAAACGLNPLSPDPTPAPPTQTLPLDPTASPTNAATQTPYVITTTPAGLAAGPQGLFFLSLAEAGHNHLFTYSPQNLPLTRLTADAWDDVDPAIGPDGNWLAFASNRNGPWDLYLLDLTTGSLRQVTNSPEYEAAPSWSPDGAWLAYESYVSDNLEIFIRSVTDPNQAAIQLTLGPSLDVSPVWSPRGRQIAFTSNSSGEPEIWIADLDRSGEDRLVNISQNAEGIESHPAWSPDGTRLAWASADPASGVSGIYVWNGLDPQAPARWIGSGDWPSWQDDDHVASRVTTPNQAYLAAYDAANGALSLPPVRLPGSLLGFSYGITSRPMPGAFQAAWQSTPAPLYAPQAPSAGRAALVALSGVQAPYPQLHEQAINSFQALRTQVAVEVGWDALASLENAYVPLTTPLEPGLGTDWLYSGRAFSLNPALIDAGYMVVVREDFGQQTYWRIYLRTSAQDGSQGAPLQQVPWDLAARTGDSSAYERGGRLMTAIPAGYWLDLTALAVQYDWERLPALLNWRTYYAGARFNELAFTQGLDWDAAMLQLYPPEILVTPTVLIPPTRTYTRTPLWYRSPTPTRTPSPVPTENP